MCKIQCIHHNRAVTKELCLITASSAKTTACAECGHAGEVYREAQHRLSSLKICRAASSINHYDELGRNQMATTIYREIHKLLKSTKTSLSQCIDAPGMSNLQLDGKALAVGMEFNLLLEDHFADELYEDDEVDEFLDFWLYVLEFVMNANKETTRKINADRRIGEYLTQVQAAVKYWPRAAKKEAI